VIGGMLTSTLLAVFFVPVFFVVVLRRFHVQPAAMPSASMAAVEPGAGSA
jgi:multidrug efflux pump